MPGRFSAFDDMGGLLRIVLLLLGALLAEAILQMATSTFPFVEARLSGLKPRYVADPVLDVRGDSSLPEYDPFGFRNDARPPRAEIVAIGDSQTEGSGVARENAWPQQLAGLRKESVYQLAFGSYGPGHYLALTDDALSLEPQTVIVAVYTGNDLAGAYEWVYVNGRNPELRSDSAERRAELARADRERGPIDRAWQSARDAEKGLYGRPLLSWLRTNVEGRSKLMALYEQLEWRISGRASNLDRDAGPAEWSDVVRTIDRVPPEILFPFEDGAVRTVFTPQARLAAQDLDDARIAEGLRLTLAFLDQIAAKCRGRSELRVLLMPTKELVFAARVQARVPNPPQSFLRMVERESTIRTQIAAHLHEHGIATIDSLPAMRALLASDDHNGSPVNPYSQTWDGHPATPGYTAVSRAVAAALSRPPA